MDENNQIKKTFGPFKINDPLYQGIDVILSYTFNTEDNSVDIERITEEINNHLYQYILNYLKEGKSVVQNLFINKDDMINYVISNLTTNIDLMEVMINFTDESKEKIREIERKRMEEMMNR